MALLAVDTGLRHGNVCSLQWDREVPLPELGRSLFVVVAESVESRRGHVAILDDAAWSKTRTVLRVADGWSVDERPRGS